MDQLLSQYFPTLHRYPELREELQQMAQLTELPKNTELLHEGSFVKVIPLVVSGLIKVYKEDQSGAEVLLYYIKPSESCIMSLTACMKNSPSKVKAIVEEDVKVLAVSASDAVKLAAKYPEWNTFAYDLFSQRFDELLEVVQLLTFSKMDRRLMEFLKKESEAKGTRHLELTHKEVARELGAAREVISRLLKQLEQEGLIKLHHGRIEML